MFGWHSILKSLAQNDILKVDAVGKLKLDEVKDYLILCNQERINEEYKNNKNSIGI